MKKIVLLILLCFVVGVEMTDAQMFYGTTDLKTFRDGRDHEFRNQAESPLRETDFTTFERLKYFAVNDQVRVIADFKRTPEEKYFWMPTSSGKTTKYVKYGILSFNLAGKDYALNVYQWELPKGEKYQKYQELLLIPFKDLTNGAETYKVGRYIYITTPTADKVILDFNLAFNPSCAYGSNRYSCPLPPKDNHLPTKIEAGEKAYLSETEN